MTPHELVGTIKKHERFVAQKPDGSRANLQYQELSGLKLTNLELSHAVASGANFSKCQLMGAKLPALICLPPILAMQISLTLSSIVLIYEELDFEEQSSWTLCFVMPTSGLAVFCL